MPYNQRRLVRAAGLPSLIAVFAALLVVAFWASASQASPIITRTVAPIPNAYPPVPRLLR